jgi:4-hydroxy-2-oxoheptanedioate aldolase
MGGVVPIVRIDRDDPYLVRKALEIGAGGIIVPDVCSVAQAESVVAAAKFPPLGNRGLSRMCWSGAWGATSGDEWIEWSNREPMIGIMIENVDAMSSIDNIVAVEGLDFIFFGSADYSMSIGLAAPNAND